MMRTGVRRVEGEINGLWSNISKHRLPASATAAAGGGFVSISLRLVCYYLVVIIYGETTARLMAGPPWGRCQPSQPRYGPADTSALVLGAGPAGPAGPRAVICIPGLCKHGLTRGMMDGRGDRRAPGAGFFFSLVCIIRSGGR